jgi:cysteine synthase A
MAGYAENVCDLIGQTPMVKLNRVLPENMLADKILLKLEMQNPGGSIKDRIALSMIEEAEKRGEIEPGKTTIVEATSGNTGIGLAMVAAARGYKCIIAMPQVPAMYERYVIDRKFGAEVHLLSVNKDDMEKSFDNMLNYAKDLVAANTETHWMPSQFANVDNPKVHYETTGPEIWAQTGGDIDIFVAGAGTGGTLAGGGKYLIEQNPDMEIVCVEPTEA